MGGNEELLFKTLKIKDLESVHRLYCSLSPKSEKCYNSKIYGKPKSLIWFPAQLALIISHSGFRNILQKIYPKYLYFINAIHLYEKYGFELVSTKENKSHQKEDMAEIYEMELILNPHNVKNKV